MRSRHPGYFLAAIFFTAMAVAGEVHLSGQVVAHASNGESWVIDAGPASTIWQPETSVPLHGLVFHGDNAGKLSFTWKVIAKPAGAEVTIAHPADLQTTARLQQPGDYRFELVAASGAAIQRDYVNATLFAPRAPARAYQPYLGGRYQPVPDYPPEWKAKYFPPVEMHYQHQGHLDDAFGKLPEPFVHPRLFVSPDELFDLRLKLKTTDFGRKRMARIREAVGHKAGTIGPWENEALATKYSPYQPFFPVWDEARQRDMPGRGVAETMLNESFRCLIDADAEGARRVAAALTVTCEGLLEKVLQPGAGNRKNWQDFPHGMMGRFAIPIIYDFVHPWMTDAQRKVVRDCIAEAAGGRWSIGMGGVNALNGNSSNWIIWITGDLFLHHAAIYREDGFDEKSYHEIVALFQRFYTIGWFEEDGDPLEAIGKQAFSMNKFLPLIRGGKPWDASLASYHFHAKYQLGLLFPWGTEFLSDEWLGGPTVVRGDGATLLKQSYPEDRLIDFMFRNAMGEDYAGGIGGIYNPTIELISNLNPNDVQGPKDFMEHIKWVEEKDRTFTAQLLCPEREYHHHAIVLAFDGRALSLLSSGASRRASGR